MADLISMLAAAAGSGGPTDPFFNQTTLLLHGDGTNGAQNNTFLDGSTNNFTITRNGNTTQGTFSPFSVGAGEWSNYMTSTTQWLSIANTTALDLPGDFTIEAWVFCDSTANRSHQIVGKFDTLAYAWLIGVNPSTGSFFLVYGNSGSYVGEVGFGSVFTPNQWVHVAVTRSGSTVRGFVNGVQQGSNQTITSNLSATATTFIGRDDTTTRNFSGHISNLRVVKGTAVYTANFTPSTTPLTAITNTSLLTCQSNRFVDNSTNAFAITRNGDVRVTPFSPFAPSAAYSASTNGGSGYFDGSGDYLSFTEFSSATDFTCECWFYRGPDVAARHTLFGGNRTVSNSRNCQLAVSNGGAIMVILNDAVVTNFNDVGGNVVPRDSWNHIVYVRSSTTISVFVNGSRIATGTSSATLYVTQVGAYIDALGASVSNGYISNARVTNTAVYDPSQTTLTVPTAPVTAISGTSLLLNFTNAGIFDNTGKNNLETVGNAQIDTTTKKYGTGSMEFDGTGDWLLMANTPDQQLGAGNFTIEFWVYLATGDIGSARGLVAKGTSTTGFLVSLDSSQKVVFTFTTSTITSSGAITTNAWNHIAVVREGTGSNQTKIYIGGTNDGTGTVSTDFNQTSVMYVGCNRTAGDPMKGFIDDLRITKGVARYTAAFTPPTAAFPNE